MGQGFHNRRAAEDVLVRHIETGESMVVPRATLRAAPDEYQTIHHKFVEPTALEIACANILALKTTWKAPDLEGERAEFERASKTLGVSADALLDSAREAPTVALSDAMWSKMENTDSWGTDTVDKAIEYARLYDKDIRDLILGLGGSMATPMVIQRPDGGTVLVGGNTRLMTFRAFGLRPQILLIPLPVKNFPLYEGKSTMPRNAATEFQHALTVRNVAARFIEASSKEATEFPTQEALDTYLKAHPGADKSKHTVKKTEKAEGDGKTEEPKKQLGESFKPTRHHQDLGGRLQQWHGPGTPAINEVGSSLTGGKPVPRKKLMDAAKELSRMIPDAEAGKHGWSKKDVKELKQMSDHLKNLHDNVE